MAPKDTAKHFFKLLRPVVFLVASVFFLQQAVSPAHAGVFDSVGSFFNSAVEQVGQTIQSTLLASGNFCIRGRCSYSWNSNIIPTDMSDPDGDSVPLYIDDCPNEKGRSDGEYHGCTIERPKLTRHTYDDPNKRVVFQLEGDWDSVYIFNKNGNTLDCGENCIANLARKGGWEIYVSGWSCPAGETTSYKIRIFAVRPFAAGTSQDTTVSDLPCTAVAYPRASFTYDNYNNPSLYTGSDTDKRDQMEAAGCSVDISFTLVGTTDAYFYANGLFNRFGGCTSGSCSANTHLSCGTERFIFINSNNTDVTGGKYTYKSFQIITRPVMTDMHQGNCFWGPEYIGSNIPSGFPIATGCSLPIKKAYQFLWRDNIGQPWCRATTLTKDNFWTFACNVPFEMTDDEYGLWNSPFPPDPYHTKWTIYQQ